MLKVEPAAIELERPLQELGLDSLTAFELKNRIEIELGVALPVGKFLQRPTIATIAPAVVEAISTDSRTGAIDPVEIDGPGMNMSIGQEALWFVNRFDPANPAYGLAACLAFRPHSMPTLSTRPCKAWFSPMRICGLPSRVTASVRCRRCCRRACTS